ncbi:MAG: diguanylate cyclase [Bdellovibrionota bacterium]
MAEEHGKARIIVADDDVESAKVVEQALKLDGHQSRICADGEAALHLVRSWMPHVVLLDINMPKYDGLECLKKIRAMGGGEYIGVLLVTANAALEQIVAGLDFGADDYIVKPYRIDELRARVRACFRIKNLHDALRRANKKLEDAASTDDLTTLYNMRYTMKRLSEEVENAKRNKSPISCVMFDMDHFKMVNDKHDHLFGSHVLKEIGKLLQGMVRASDIAARYGGDEFFIAMPGTHLKDAFNVADRIRKAIEAHVFKMGTYSIKVTASFGVSGTQGAPDDVLILDARELMRSADAALYGAKNSGRNKVESFNFVKP